MSRRASLGLLAALLAVSVSGCEGAGTAHQRATPQRIVAISPTAVEILDGLGLTRRLVAVGDFCDWPPQVRTLPRIGGLFNPNVERIVSLRPDLVVLLRSERDVGDKLSRLGLPRLVIANERLADVEASVTALAARCGVPAAGERLLAEMRAGLAPLPAPLRRPRVLLSLGREPGSLAKILVAGPDNFFADLLGRIGAENVFADAPVPYPQVGLEEILRRDPDVIVELQALPLDARAAGVLAAEWQGVPQLRAVREGRIRVISGTHVLVPGPRLVQLDRELVAAIKGAA